MGVTGSPLLPEGTGVGPLLRPPLDADVAGALLPPVRLWACGWCLDGTAAGELLPLGAAAAGAWAAGSRWGCWGLLLPLSHGGWGRLQPLASYDLQPRAWHRGRDADAPGTLLMLPWGC